MTKSMLSSPVAKCENYDKLKSENPKWFILAEKQTKVVVVFV